MGINREDIKHLANLSALEFSDEEIDGFQKEFNAILNFVDQINNAKVDEEYKYTITKLENLREDEVKEGLSQEEVLQNAPNKKMGCFAVPLMMD